VFVLCAVDEEMEPFYEEGVSPTGILFYIDLYGSGKMFFLLPLRLDACDGLLFEDFETVPFRMNLMKVRGKEECCTCIFSTFSYAAQHEDKENE